MKRETRNVNQIAATFRWILQRGGEEESGVSIVSRISGLIALSRARGKLAFSQEMFLFFAFLVSRRSSPPQSRTSHADTRHRVVLSSRRSRPKRERYIRSPRSLSLSLVASSGLFPPNCTSLHFVRSKSDYLRIFVFWREGDLYR